ncbi:transcription initiation factor TFIID subunit 12, partial [Biomphalaria pfeifferi]
MPTGTSISSNSISISASPILTTTTFPSNSIVYSSSIIPTSTTVPSSSFTYSQSPQTSSSGLQSSLNQQTTLKASSLFPAPSTLLYSSTQASAYPPSPSYSVSQTTQLTHVSTSDMLVFSSWSIVPSKTTVPMSSSAIVSQPPPTTPLPRIGGDKSVSFNDTDLDAGLCLYADAKQGFGFAPHPQDCDKYIQCFLSNDRNVTASIRYCPRGLFWNQEKLTCVKPDGCNSITTCR